MQMQSTKCTLELSWSNSIKYCEKSLFFFFFLTEVTNSQLHGFFFFFFYKENVTPPARHPKWMSSGGATICDCDSLTFYFSSFRADTCIHMHNFCNNKNSFYIYIIRTTIVAFIIFYTHILESLYLYYYNSLLQNYTYKIRDFGSSAGEHLSLRWPSLLM